MDKPIDKYYEHLLEKDYSVWLEADTYEELWRKIDDYRNNTDTLYIDIKNIVYCDFYSAFIKVVKKESYYEKR